jgi:hypothetical protein
MAQEHILSAKHALSPVSLTAMVTNSALGNSIIPTGSVTFKNALINSSITGYIATVSNSVYSLAVIPLLAGNNATIQVNNGDGIFNSDDVRSILAKSNLCFNEPS